MDDKVYVQYAQWTSDINELENKLNKKKVELEEMRAFLSTDGSYGLYLSAHAFTNISERMSSLAMENSEIYKDLINTEDPSKSILLPSNLKAFIIGILASARTKNQYVEKPSKNGKGGKEFHYESEIKKWGTQKDALIFTAIVESNAIKTGYFNWSGRP